VQLGLIKVWDEVGLYNYENKRFGKEELYEMADMKGVRYGK